jgi:RND family efflux transporter MFP subunit
MSSLRDDLASLKIERKGSGTRGQDRRPASGAARSGRRGGGGFLGLLLWLIPLSMLGAAGYYGYTQWKEIRSKPEVTVGIVQTMTTGEAEKLLSAKGYLKSRNQSMIGAKVPGRVQELLIEEGVKVKRGDLLAVLEHNDIDAQIASGRAQITRAKADVLEAEADLDEKQKKAKRSERLGQRSMVSVEEREQNDSAVRRAEAKIASLKATIELQQQLVRQTEVTLENMFIRAPFDGTVVKKEAEIGEMITGGGMGSGLSIGRAYVATLANLNRMEVETDVSENLLARLAISQPAEISVAAAPTKRYRGRLRQIIPISDRGRGTVKVMVEFLEPDEQLFPELVATVHFLPDKALKSPDAGKAYLFVPKSAIVEEEGHSYVFQVDNKKNLHKVEVDVVVTNDDLARVEKGLEAGAQVVLAPPKTLRDGEAVKVAE